MRVRINIDFELSPRVKRALLVGVPAGIILAGSIAYAGVPNVFKDGDALSAQTMNDNFTSLDGRLGKLESLSVKQSADGGFSVNATFCGATANVTVGDLSGLPVTGTGYTRARTQCQVTCASPGAHMCTSEEMVRSSQLGMTLPAAAWFSSGAEGASLATNDCRGWTVGTSANRGGVWNSSPSASTTNNCDSNLPVLCCN